MSNSDFRSHTCGECAWMLDHGWQTDIDCRKIKSVVPKDAPACPAYVPLVAPDVEDRKVCPACGTTEKPECVCLASHPPLYFLRCHCRHESKAFHDSGKAEADFYRPMEGEPTP